MEPKSRDFEDSDFLDLDDEYIEQEKPFQEENDDGEEDDD